LFKHVVVILKNLDQFLVVLDLLSVDSDLLDGLSEVGREVAVVLDLLVLCDYSFCFIRKFIKFFKLNSQI